MATPKVNVNTLNLLQGGFTEIENFLLYIGFADNPANEGKVITIGHSTDLDAVLGANDSELKTQIAAARDNAGQIWSCAAYVAATGDTWQDGVNAAMAGDVSPEGVFVCMPIADKADLVAMQASAMAIGNTYARRVFFIACVRGIDANTESWADYLAFTQPITDDLAGYRVGVVPLLHGNDAGSYAGRLSNSEASVADSPMRTAANPVIGLGALPVDNSGAPLEASTLKALDVQGYSVPWMYTDYPGVYWADGSMFDVPGGDYQVIENLRVMDKIARRVRVLAIGRVADRRLNSTPNSIATHKTFFARPMREMSRTATVNGVDFPADIKPPKDNAIEIVWSSNTAVTIYMTATPYESGKEITVAVGLDLSS